LKENKKNTTNLLIYCIPYQYQNKGKSGGICTKK
jgi:hypothetical protein